MSAPAPKPGPAVGFTPNMRRVGAHSRVLGQALEDLAEKLAQVYDDLPDEDPRQIER